MGWEFELINVGQPKEMAFEALNENYLTDCGYGCNDFAELELV